MTCFWWAAARNCVDCIVFAAAFPVVRRPPPERDLDRARSIGHELVLPRFLRSSSADIISAEFIVQCTPVTGVSTFCLASVLTRYCVFWLFCLLVYFWRPPVGSHSAIRIFPPGSGSWLFLFWQGNFSPDIGRETRSSVPLIWICSE